MSDSKSIWVEKYRPQRLEDIVGIPQTLLTNLKVSSEPVVLHGPSGIGKTSLALCLARAGAPVDKIKQQQQQQQHRDNVNDNFNVLDISETKTIASPLTKKSDKTTIGTATLPFVDILELNASDDRTPKIMLEKVKQFAQGSHYKVVVLDECESLLPAAQDVLQGIFDIHGQKTRFILTCNSLSGLKKSLLSRCTTHYIRALPDAAVRSVIERIMAVESVSCASSQVDTIISEAHGDLRKAINMLEAGRFATHRPLVVLANQFWKNLDNLELMVNNCVTIYGEGFGVCEFVETLTSTLPSNGNVNATQHLALATELATQYKKHSMTILNTKLQFVGVGALIFQISRKHK